MKLTREEFKALQKYWYDKAKEHGFKDVEVLKEDDLELLRDNITNYKIRDLAHKQQIVEYYALMTHHAHDPETKYKNEVHRYIMMKHCEGTKIKNIVLELAALGESRERRNIRLVIRRYEKEWKVKHYK